MAKEKLSILVEGITIEYEYKNVKSLRMTVYPPDGRVKISAPLGTVPAVLRKFAVSRIAWISRHREKYLNHSKIQSTLRNHSAVFVWGAEREFVLAEHRGNSRIKIENGIVKMYIRPLTPKIKKMEILDRWYRRIVKEAALPLIEKWEKILNIEVKKLFLRKMKSHWGSCNYQKQTLRLNSELGKRSPECLEYVIVHEMLHIIEKGHNKNYYSMLGRYVPEWKAIRKKMNTGVL